MKDGTKCVLFNKKEKLATSKGEEHLYSDALVIHKNDSNYILTIHGDWTFPQYESIDGNKDILSGYVDYYKSGEMYKINAVEANILSKTSPKSLIFKGILKAIRRRQNIMDVKLDDNAKKIRDSIISKGEKVALSKQVEEGVCLKQRIAKEKGKEEEKREQKEKQSIQRAGKTLSDFLNSGKDM